MRRANLVLLPLLALGLSGCLAKTALDVATAPVKIAGRAVDLATTSQEEADRNYGRKIRKLEAKLGKLEKRYDKQVRACQKGDRRACADAPQTYAEIQQIKPLVPAEPI